MLQKYVFKYTLLIRFDITVAVKSTTNESTRTAIKSNSFLYYSFSTYEKDVKGNKITKIHEKIGYNAFFIAYYN